MMSMKSLLGVLFLALCLNECQSQMLSAYAKTCKDCNSTNANCEENSGYVVCSCKPGFIGNGLNCTPMSLCSKYSCCPQGYEWDKVKKNCVDINECTNSSLNKCSPLEACINKNGVYLCSNKKLLCSDASCPLDQDCMMVNGSPSCSDPCTNYEVLNGENRLYTIRSTGRFLTDRYNIGWFRYNGQVIMKEGCVGAMKCGSLEPFSLNGSLPAVGEGVAMVPLLINSLSGCTPGATIPVKACPGGYYVYKFSGTLKNEVYCTDLQISTTIKTSFVPANIDVVTTDIEGSKTTEDSTSIEGSRSTEGSTPDDDMFDITSTKVTFTTTLDHQSTHPSTSIEGSTSTEGSTPDDDIFDITSTKVTFTSTLDHQSTHPSTSVEGSTPDDDIFDIISTKVTFTTTSDHESLTTKSHCTLPPEAEKLINITNELLNLTEKLCNMPIHLSENIIDKLGKVADKVHSEYNDLLTTLFN